MPSFHVLSMLRNRRVSYSGFYREDGGLKIYYNDYFVRAKRSLFIYPPVSYYLPTLKKNFKL